MENQKKKIDIIFHGMDYCPRCKQNTIELYDYFNGKLRYKEMVRLFAEGKPLDQAYLNKTAFYTFRCTNCGKAYPIIWAYGFPIPNANPLDMKIFMRAFKDGGEK